MEKARGPESHADLRRPLDSLAWNYEMQRRYADAVPLYRANACHHGKGPGSRASDLREPLGKLAYVYEAATSVGGSRAACANARLPSRKRPMVHDDPCLRLADQPRLSLQARRAATAKPSRSIGVPWRLPKKTQGGADNALRQLRPQLSLSKCYNAQARYGEAEPLMRAELAVAERKAAADPKIWSANGAAQRAQSIGTAAQGYEPAR